MWQSYYQPTTVDEALGLLRDHAGRAHLVAGGTDVLVELSRGVRPTETLIDVSLLRGLRYVRAEDGALRLGALATHNDVIASPHCVRHALPLAQACWEVGAPQIRTRATIAGNLVTASPANDTITPLLALGAEVVLASAAGERSMPLSDFYTRLRRTVLRPDEMLREVRVPLLNDDHRGIFLKLGLRRAQAISVINVAAVLAFEGERVAEARLALGCVAPTVVRVPGAEAYLIGRVLDESVCVEAGRLAAAEVAPIDDVRGSAGYRRATVATLVAEALRRLANGTEAAGWPADPVLLDTCSEAATPSGGPPFDGVIMTTINGAPYQLERAAGKSLLNALREDAGLTGTKEGCAEGECGACTVWLNGQAVMSCLTPAPQAHGASLTTIEGLAGMTAAESLAGASGDAALHPLQRAFIAHGAVQCGFCIPGMLMAGAKLLEERAQPDLKAARVAISGNLCRCTGYRKILDAVLAASEKQGGIDAG